MKKLVLEFVNPLSADEKSRIENVIRIYGGDNVTTNQNTVITTGAYIEVHSILDVAENIGLDSAKMSTLH